jgi:endonuclease/exonuclease/phosphatase family metal-dependent hydrolase
MKLKILTYNIHKGFDWGKKNYFLADIKNLVKSSRANIVFLQEVVGENTKYKKKGMIDSQFEFIADSVWTHYSYAKNAVYDHGHHGNLILSEYPIESWENINISTNAFEKRGLLYCKIAISEKINLNIICVHLDLLNRGRHIQYKMIQEYIHSLNLPPNAPLILAGDFNDWNNQAKEAIENNLQMIEVHKSQHGILARTFPAALPILCLDRIYIKNMKVVHSYVLPKVEDNHFSDHLPLFCEVQLNAI